MSRLWDRNSAIDPMVLAYTVGDDYALDDRLVAYDLRASRAHASMLHASGFLDARDLEALERALNERAREGWSIESVHFVMREGSHRPAMAYLFFVRVREPGGA